MKKILFAAVALVAMASCATDEVVMRPENKLAIEFDNAFVENSTRAADINASNLADFGVYGSIANTNGTALTFNNTVVSKNANTGAYEYSPAQVWASNATYTFAAFAPFTNKQWSYAVTNNQAYNGVITFNNEAAEANQDLLFASEKRTTEVIDSKPEAVALTFNHMLSRVKFHFTNNFHDGSNIDLKVTEVTITDAHSTGTLAVNDGQVGDWTVGTETFSRNFGDVKTPHNNTTLDEYGGNGETEHFYLIPTEGEFNVTFKVRMTVAEGTYFDYTHNAVLKINMEKGHSYVVRTALNQTNTDPQGEMYAIEFKVEKVEDWEDFSDVALEATTVDSAAELAAAVAEGGEIRLTQDINLDTTRAAEAGLVLNKDVVIDGNGYALTTSAVRAIQIIDAKNVTIKNLTLNAGGERGIQLQTEGQNLVVENVKATAANYTLNLTGNCKNATVVVNNSYLKGLNTVNVWGEGNTVTINNTTLACEDNTSTESYALVCVNAANNYVTVNGGEVVITGTNTNGTTGGCISADGGEITFNGTQGNCTVKGHAFAINYANGYAYTFPTFEDALEKAVAGETIVVLQNVTTDTTLKVTKKITLDLNGKTINVTNPGVNYTDGITATTGADLTITGNGIVSADWGAIVAMKDAKVVIENGTFYGNESEVVFVQNEASVVILGGTYKQNEDASITLNQLDKHRETSSIVVKGGKYFQFNPADNAAEGEHTNFVAAGYTVEQDGDWFVVK